MSRINCRRILFTGPNDGSPNQLAYLPNNFLLQCELKNLMVQKEQLTVLNHIIAVNFDWCLIEQQVVNEAQMREIKKGTEARQRKCDRER
eukprot:XP_016660237.1 PREDICTED: uncharacterized protein LOC107883857 isoform X2 [Acyrthosiphon pisum]